MDLGDIGFANKDMTECQSSGTGNYLDKSLSRNQPGKYFKVQEIELSKINFI